MRLLRDSRTGCVTGHTAWSLPLKPKVLLTYSAREGKKVEADILILFQRLKTLMRLVILGTEHCGYRIHPGLSMC